MKRILITGANSYIGVSFETYIKSNYPAEYSIDTVDMIDGSWREKSFAGYDAVFHVAGIAHQKETTKNKHLYYEVNRQLAVETARKAKDEGVKHFLFLSSMSVYGVESGEITKDTRPNPKSNYGKSKWEAEKELSKLQGNAFSVALIRPPMVYGKDCKGNFQTIVKIVKKTPVFPKVKNRRSMIYIDTLCEYVKDFIDQEASGVLLPQNAEYINTSEMAEMIAEKLGKKLYLSATLGLAVKIICPFVSVAKKAFGTLVYEKSSKLKTNEKTNRESVLESV